MKTHQVLQLSSNLFAINAIILNVADHTLMLAAVQQGERPVKIMFVDQDTQELTVLHEQDSDTTAWDISYDHMIPKPEKHMPFNTPRKNSISRWKRQIRPKNR